MTTAIDIQKAETTITTVDPKLTPLNGEINTEGKYLLFDRIKINESNTADISYLFNAFIAIKTVKGNTKLQYAPLSELLNKLIKNHQTNQNTEVGDITPFAVKGFIVYKVPITVNNYIKDNEITY